MPAISIVVPAHNAASRIGDCLGSLLGQTLRDIEVVCVDDASTDGTAGLVKKLASEDSRLAYVRNDRGPNLSGARRAGTARTTGAYVMYVDGSDELVPDACARLLAEMHRSEVDILHFGVRVEAGSKRDGEAAEEATGMTSPAPQSLAGSSILTRCFLDWSYDYGIDHKLYRGDLARGAMRSLGEIPGASAAEDVVEYFAIALAARTYRAIAPSHYYVHHLGRERVGDEGMTLKGFERSCIQRRGCCDALSALIARADADPSAEVRKCVASVFDHELSGTMGAWQNGVALPDRAAALAMVRDMWGERPVATELYRLLRDDAYAFCHGGLSLDAKRAALDRFETNKACLEELLPEAQLWDDGEAALLSAREGARVQYEELLDAMAMDHESSDGDAAWIMSEREGRCSRLDHILGKKRPDETFAALFRHIFVDGRFEAISTLQGAERLRVTRREVRTIGLYYFKLSGGGAEKVTRSLAGMLLGEGYRVVLFCDALAPQGCVPHGAALVRLPDLRTTNPGNYLRRGHVLQEALRRHKVDLLVCSQWQSHCLEWDQFVTKALGVAFVVHTHGSCTHVIAHDSEDDYALPIAYRLSDAVVCLDDMDRAFWSQFNDRTFTTVNRTSFSTSDVPAAPLASHKIIWVGRLSMDEKRPEDALEILSRVRLTVPDARLEIVGPGEPEVLDRLRSRARELGVDDATSFLGPRDDVSDLMSGASVHLLTSPSEGFSLVVLESKTCGVPCVMYRLPIRFSREGKGLVNVRQGDVDGAAKAIAKVLLDDDLRHRMGREARESAKEIEAFDLPRFWKSVFAMAIGDHRQTGPAGGPDAAARLEMQEVMCATAYADVLRRNRERADQEGRIRELRERVYGLEAELDRLRASRAFRVGNALARPIRLIRNR